MSELSRSLRTIPPVKLRSDCLISLTAWSKSSAGVAEDDTAR